MTATILIVDDNLLNLKLASVIVAADGHTPEVATSAAEALRAIARRRPDLILMDLQMPEVDGLELTRTLKLSRETSDIPIIALTAAAMRCDRERALAAGCAGFITKPIDTRQFTGQIASFLGPPGPSAA